MYQKNHYTRRVISLLTTLIALVFFGSTLNAQIAQGGNFTIDQLVVASGGTSADTTGNVYKVVSTVGETVAGTTSSGGTFSVKGGFLAAAPLAPTASSVSVGGRATTADGRGIRNVIVTLTDSSGATKTTTTTGFGYYRFDNVSAGETYIITVNGKRHAFSQSSQVLNVNRRQKRHQFYRISERLFAVVTK